MRRPPRDDDVSGLIDTCLFGKPGRFEGDINFWKQWRFQMMAYVGAVESDIADDLAKAQALTESITFIDSSSEKRARSQLSVTRCRNC